MSEAKTDRELFYGDNVTEPNGPFATELRDDFNRLTDGMGWTPEEAKEEFEEASQTFFDLGLERQDASRLHARYTGYALKPPDEDTVQQWDGEARNRLREAHGHEQATQMLKAAQDHIRSSTYLKKMADSGLGSHPDFVVTIAETAWRKKMEG